VTETSFRCPDYVVDQVMKKRERLRVFDRFAPAETALLVIDMQRFYLEQMPAGKEIVPNVNRIADALRQLGGLVVWVTMTAGVDGESLWPLYHERFHAKAGAARHRDGLTAGAPGHELWPELDTRTDDLFVSKWRFSPFVPRSAEIDLDRELRDRGVENLIICGVATNFCCETTARDAMMLDYPTVVVSDGCAARHPEDHTAGLQTVFQSFGDVLSTREVLTTLLVESAPPEVATSADR
jgi:ureidoacrylate peracid hydrolase